MKIATKSVRFGLVIIVAAVFFTFGAVYDRDLSANSDEIYEGLKTFADVIDFVEKNYVDHVEPKELIEKAIQGMVSSLDPHSSLLPPEAFEDLKIETKGEFGGIGIVISMPKGLLTVISPIENTPAHKAGVKSGDIIIKITDESTKGMMIWEAVKRMRGPKGEEVSITVLRSGVSEPIDFELIRDIIPIESVKSIALKPGYGYIRVTNFQIHTASDLKDALVEIESGDVPLKGLVLDLRDNPGGLLDQAIKVSDLFLEDGVIVSIKGRRKDRIKVYEAQNNDVKRDYPIALLISGGSASASEIVAGALQDHKRALIIGTTSFGKGSVQTVETLQNGFGLKLTIARYYTPSGKSIQAQGIKPDIVLKREILSEQKFVSEKEYLKEKDLKNHLNAQPDESREKTPKDEEIEKKKTTSEIDSRYGTLNRERLLLDNQVGNALNLLLGYEILTANGVQ
ncbi:MAG TPA: peptidase S41 [Desulfobacteraceae bacterium]|nr:peptidase S41 [Desulfobacteraceae bacterium]